METKKKKKFNIYKFLLELSFSYRIIQYQTNGKKSVYGFWHLGILAS